MSALTMHMFVSYCNVYYMVKIILSCWFSDIVLVLLTLGTRKKIYETRHGSRGMGFGLEWLSYWSSSHKLFIFTSSHKVWRPEYSIHIKYCKIERTQYILSLVEICVIAVKRNLGMQIRCCNIMSVWFTVNY